MRTIKLANKSMHCPTCGNKSIQINFFNNSRLRMEYKNRYGEKIPSSVVFGDYKILKCTMCELEWSDPQKPGNSNYYSYITQQVNYYPGNRWEWDFVVNKIKTQKNPKVLEIGCGEGHFLDLCKTNNINAIGIDTTKSSVRKAKAKKLKVYLMNLEKYIKLIKGETYDFIVAYHLLEHIPYPKRLLKLMLKLLSPTGLIYISTPYVAHGEITQWFDCLNYPPHHLTRWNQKAYRYLAVSLKLKIKLFMPKADLLVHRILNSLALIYYGPLDTKHNNLLSLISKSILNPIITIREIWNQIYREKIIIDDIPKEKVITNYVVLVELSK